MQINIKPGKYVAAVSGGVDSMVLLDLLGQVPHTQIVVAHFDHGVREDSQVDRELVQKAAKNYGLPFMYEQASLGPNVSEDAARQARYGFLRRARQQAGADAIITAHHQDDMLETVFINMLRGTGRKGLSSLRSRPGVLRPLLPFKKSELLAYARQNGIKWHEDSTNQNEDYLRNYVRRTLMPKLDAKGHKELIKIIERSAGLNDEIDSLLNAILSAQPAADELNRYMFIMLPHKISAELLAEWLRQKQVMFDRRTIERLVVFAKTARPGKRADISSGSYLQTSAKALELKSEFSGQ